MRNAPKVVVPAEPPKLNPQAASALLKILKDAEAKAEEEPTDGT